MVRGAVVKNEEKEEVNRGSDKQKEVESFCRLSERDTAQHVSDTAM